VCISSWNYVVLQGEPLGYIKLQVRYRQVAPTSLCESHVHQAANPSVCHPLQIIQQQTPISRVEVYLAKSWRRLYRSGDGFFEPGHDLNVGPVVRKTF
jgi:hypothetical protein